MQFVIEKNFNNTWGLAPTEGLFAGQTIASAEALNMSDVRFHGRQMIGSIKACWGLVIMYDDFDIDVATLRGLSVGKRFDANAEQQVVLDSDGVKDSHTLRLLRGAKRVVTLGSAIWAKGTL